MEPSLCAELSCILALSLASMCCSFCDKTSAPLSLMTNTLGIFGSVSSSVYFDET
jgi:hypothetical protein